MIKNFKVFTIVLTILFIFTILSLPALADTVDDAIAEGNYCMSQGDYQGAIDCYNRALQIDPDNRDALFYKAQAYQGLQSWDQARNCCDRVLEINSGDAAAIALLGTILSIGFGETIYDYNHGYYGHSVYYGGYHNGYYGHGGYNGYNSGYNGKHNGGYHSGSHSGYNGGYHSGSHSGYNSGYHSWSHS